MFAAYRAESGWSLEIGTGKGSIVAEVLIVYLPPPKQARYGNRKVLWCLLSWLVNVPQ